MRTRPTGDAGAIRSSASHAPLRWTLAAMLAIVWPALALADSTYGLTIDQHELRFMFGQHSAGVDLELGRNGPRDVVRAAERYRQAAVLGFPLAQNNLGRLYENGRGVAQDFITAYVWYTLAAARGDEMARINRDTLIRRLTPAQLAAGQRRAQALARHLP